MSRSVSSWVAGIRRLVGLRSRPTVVGTDLNGNKYLETQPRGGLGRLRRTVKMAGISTDEYTENAIPHEWEQWLRGSRQAPPTHEELLHRIKQSEMMKVKVSESLERESKLRSDKDSQATQQIKAEEHASAPSFRSSHKSSSDPTSTGKDFQPGSWKP